MKRWCKECGKPVHVETKRYTTVMDGRQYDVGTQDFCAECGSADLEDIDVCPICGDEVGESQKFCKDCRDNMNQHLTEFKEHYKMTQEDLEDLVAMTIGW